MKIPPRTRLEIDLDILLANARALKDMAGSRDVMAVIKADAYGCGAVMTARELIIGGICRFAVANLAEAVNLRRHRVPGEILIMGYTDPSYAVELITQDITQAVVDMPHALALSQAAVEAGGKISVHIKIDTGMSRIGLDCQNPDIVGDLRKIISLPGLKVTGTFTHFASADLFDEDSDDFTKLQTAEFRCVIDAARLAGLELGKLHACNSGATLRFEDAYFDMVRPGSLVVGADPMPTEYHTVMPMRPIYSFRTIVGMLKELPAGRTVGYAQGYRTDKPSIIATLPVGYADGLSRALSGKGRVLIRGEYAPIVGRVCMDQTMVDVTGIQGVSPGDTVTIFGSDAGKEITVGEAADLMDSVHPDVLARMGRRLPIYYLRGGEVVAVLDYMAGGLTLV